MYEIILIILIILNILFGILFNFKLLKLKKNSEKIINKNLEKLKEEKKKEYCNIYNLYKNNLENIKKEFQEKEKFYNEAIKRNEKILENEEKKKNLILSQKQEIIDKELEQYRLKKEYELEENFKIKAADFDKALQEYNQKTTWKMEEAQQSLNSILEELDDYRRRRAAVNEAILREKELKEKETFYKLNISENDIEDIEVLKTIESKLKNKEALNKLIFDVYISKPMKEMIKRVLNGKSISGIYKITYIPTGEAYIGRSTDINNRFKEHVLSCFSIGHIAHSSLHTKMARDGIWNFTFEVIEEVSKDKLNEREKYWIDFYDTVNYGLNEKRGG